jgi:hypothetical protein
MKFILLLSLIFLAMNAKAVTGDYAHNVWGPVKENPITKKQYRYLTSYNVIENIRPYGNFPYIEEDCHDESDRFFNWFETVSYSITYSGQIGFELLGFDLELSGERSKQVEFGFEKWVQATKGIRARHYLMARSEDWVGIVKKAEYDKETKKWIITKKSSDFRLTDLNMGLFVERKIIEVCDNQEG